MNPPVILFVDDEPTSLALVVRQFKQILGDNFRYLETNSAQQGLECIRNLIQEEWQAPVLLVVDFFMPEVDGAAFIDNFRQQSPDTNIVLCTSCEDDKILEALEQKHQLLPSIKKYHLSEANIDSLKKQLKPWLV